jgi:hypothetical protein
LFLDFEERKIEESTESGLFDDVLDDESETSSVNAVDALVHSSRRTINTFHSRFKASRFWRFHAAPLTRFGGIAIPSARLICIRFWVDVMNYISLILLHSYITLTPLPGYFTGPEIYLFLWFISLFLEEIREVCWLPISSAFHSSSNSFKSWLWSIFLLDLLGLLFHFMALLWLLTDGQ